MKQGVFAVMCTISAPLIIFEYIWLIWNWSGGGMFRLITTPVVLLLFLLGLVVITKKMRNRRLKKNVEGMDSFDGFVVANTNRGDCAGNSMYARPQCHDSIAFSIAFWITTKIL